MKRIMSLFCALCWSTFGAYAAISQHGGPFKGGYEYKKAYDYGVEIYNKTGKPLWYAIKNGDDTSELFTSRTIAGVHPAKQYTVDLDKDTTIAFWFNEPKGFESKGVLSFNKQWAFNPDPDKVYTFPKGKTIYLTVDSSQTVRPETGQFKGANIPLIGKRSESNMNLKNNVTIDQIKSLK